MDLNANALLKNYLCFGNFGLFNPQSSSKGKLINRLIKLVAFFNAFKLIIIVSGAWFGQLDLKLYLIEIYLFDEYYQRLLDVEIVIVHVGFCLGFSYWSSLNGHTRSLESFNFLLILNTKDLHRYESYRLDKQSTSRFLATYHFACLSLRLLVAAHYIFVFAAISRCLYHSFYAVNSTYFFSAALSLSVITLIGYLLLLFFTLSKFVLLLLSVEFLILCVKTVDIRMCHFIRTGLISISRQKSKKQKTNLFKAFHPLLNDFCQQFKLINSVLDSSISIILLGGFLLNLIAYFLVFIRNSLAIRLSLSVLMTAAFLFHFSFSLYNDRLRRQVRRIQKKSA